MLFLSIVCYVISCYIIVYYVMLWAHHDGVLLVLGELREDVQHLAADIYIHMLLTYRVCIIIHVSLSLYIYIYT